MELKEILSHAEAVQFLLYSIQHGKQTRTALKKALPEDVPTDAPVSYTHLTLPTKLEV